MKELVENEIKVALKKLGWSKSASCKHYSVAHSLKPEFGDYSTNVALVCNVKDAGSPLERAEKLKKLLEKSKLFEKVEVAGGGFVNIWIRKSAYADELKKVLKEADNFGRKNYGRGKKVLVEYISANPTGPLHVGNARGGPMGEAIARFLDFLNFRVEREFYVNDVGLQIERFGKSLYYWYEIKFDKKIEFPDDGYQGKYVKEISEGIQKEKKDELEKLKDQEEFIEFFIREGLLSTIKSIRDDAKLIGIEFDNWSYESDLVHSGKSAQVVKTLIDKGFTTRKEGALWFKNPQDPELKDKESVLVKSDGETVTYFTNDIAYHVDKINRGHDLLINILGANHAGHLPRFNAALRALGVPGEKIKIILYQYIRLKKSGEVMKMGKRFGNFVTLRQIIESGVEPDAFKYFILSQNPNTPFDFDLKLAKDTSEKNPVFYIKYAHARISSILRKAEEGKVSYKKPDLKLLKDEKELALIKQVVAFPEILGEIYSNFQIQLLPHYSYSVAQLFHNFYANCQVITKDKKLTEARLGLIKATQVVLKNSLWICGIEAPEKM